MIQRMKIHDCAFKLITFSVSLNFYCQSVVF